MKGFSKLLYEHLITRQKYNKLKLKLDVKCEEYDNKMTELRTEKRIYMKQKEIWENKLKEQEKEIIDLKNEITLLKKRKKRVDKNEK